METQYPQYRKYLNDKSFFKIISSREWEEIQIIGSNYVLNQFNVNIMPDRNFLHDMAFDYKENWKEISEEEYSESRKKVIASE